MCRNKYPDSLGFFYFFYFLNAILSFLTMIISICFLGVDTTLVKYNNTENANSFYFVRCHENHCWRSKYVVLTSLVEQINDFNCW